LREVAAQIGCPLGMFFGFDAFGGDLHVECAAHLDDLAQQRQRLGLIIGCADEGLVDLQLVELELPKIAEARIAGAEVIQCDPDAKLLKAAQLLQHGFGITDHDALCHFQFEPFRIDPGFGKDGFDILNKGRGRELLRREVDGHRNVLGQAGDGAAGLAQGPQTNLVDAAGKLGDGNETVRGNALAFRRCQPDQGFETGKFAAAAFNDRLVVQFEEVLFQGLFDQRRETFGFAQFADHLAVIGHVLLAAGGLGCAHGLFSSLLQYFRFDGAIVRTGNADAGCQADGLASKLKRFGKDALKIFSTGGVVRACCNGEGVAANACAKAVIVAGGTQPVRNLAQQLVARLSAQPFIDVGKPVDVYQHEAGGRLVHYLLLMHGVEDFLERGLIGQAGRRIILHQAGDVALCLSRGARPDQQADQDDEANGGGQDHADLRCTLHQQVIDIACINVCDQRADGLAP
jgi:hypothetical protein